MVDVILGLQWGDEGKGKIVDVFTPGYDIIARFQGGPNAGHTIGFDGKRFILHTIPSGIFHSGKKNVIGNGVILDPVIFGKEVASLHQAGLTPEHNLWISRRAHLILPTHRLLDAAFELAKGTARIGSTLKGIGPTYTEKFSRTGLRTGDFFNHDFNSRYNALKEQHLAIVRQVKFDYSHHLIDGQLFDAYEEVWFESLRKMRDFEFIDSEYFINQQLDNGASILAEGAQGTLLDIDFGSYPFVTSSNTITGGVCTGLGVSPHRIGKVYGVFKAYCTRVGSGPFPTELDNETGEHLRKSGREFGSTTGRPRRCGWLDIPALNYAIMLTGADELIMMKADVLDSLEYFRVCTHYQKDGAITDQIPFNMSEKGIHQLYTDMEGWNSSLSQVTSVEEFPEALRGFIHFIEEETGVPITMISTGPDRNQTMRCR